MSLRFETSKPKALLAKIKVAVDSRQIQTWEYDGDGDFTHSASSGQWVGRGWMRPKVEPGKALIFDFVKSTNTANVTAVYAVYIGRFAEMMLTHFGSDFTASSFWPRGSD